MHETIERDTAETKITLSLSETAIMEINTGIGFFDHMLHLFAFRLGHNLQVRCEGDLHIDNHHTVEDIGIALGLALHQHWSKLDGFRRYGEAAIPMDESLARCVLDISGRPFLYFNVPGGKFPCERLGGFETEMVEEFFRAVAQNARITMHLTVEYGRNAHHMVEAIFKAFGVAMKQALEIVGSGTPSTKGVL